MGELLDVVVIGAGPVGLASAERLAEEGFRVAVLEKEARPNYGKLCGGFTVTCKGSSFRAKVVVAADGVCSRTGRSIRGSFGADGLGLAVQVKSAVSREFAESARGLNVVFLGGEFSPFGYAYIFPKKSHLDVGVGALLSRVGRTGLKTYLDRVLGHYGLERASEDRYAVVPLTGPLKSVARGRVLLAGDAAGHVAPLVGEGIRFALTAGRMAAEAVSAYLKGEVFLSEMGRRYLSMLERSFYRRLRLEKLILKLFRRGGLSSGKLLRDPGMRSIVAELYLDKRDTQQLVLASLPRVLRVLV